MKLQVGDIVELNNGEVCVVDRMIGDDPEYVDRFGHGPFVIDDICYHQDGRFLNCYFDHEFSVKRIVSRANDKFKPDYNYGGCYLYYAGRSNKYEPDYNYAEQAAKHGITITVELIDGNVIVFDGKKQG